MYDPILLNEAVNIQNKLASLKYFNIIDPCNALVGIEQSQYLVMHRAPINSTTIVINAVPLKENSNVVTSKHFGNNGFETRLFKLLIRCNYQLYFKNKKYHELIDGDGNITRKFWSTVVDDGFDVVINSQLLSLHWNAMLSKARTQRKETIGPILNVCVPINGINYKEPSHFQQFVVHYNQGIFNNNIPDAIKELHVVKIASSSVKTIVASEVPIPPPPILSESAMAGSTLLSIPPGGVNHGNHELQSLPKTTRKPQKVENKLAAPLEDKEKVFQPCPSCGKSRHVKEASKTCEFLIWKKTANTKRLNKNETEHAAAVRMWLEQKKEKPQ